MSGAATSLRRRASAAAAIAAAAALTACTVGPDYALPPVSVPAAYKELEGREQEGWRPGAPQDESDRGPWWALYRDPVLDALERQIDISNQNLIASEAAYRASLALVQQSRATLFPTVSLDSSITRSERGSGSGTFGSTSGAAASGATARTAGGFGGGRAQTLYSVSGSADWNLDVWGRIRRTIEADVAGAQASAADLAAARLSAQASLATDYFQLRTQDELKRLLDATVAAYARSLQIARNRYAVGVGAQADVVSAQTQLENAQAQAINVGVQRALLEHAIAVLIGKPPGEFSIAPQSLAGEVPVIPAGVPSALLQRRPDIAAAERQAAAANARIGVAVAAFFPDLTLSGSYGYVGAELGNLVQVPNRIWSFGPALAATLFDAGLRSAQVDQARATYGQQVALYRQTVLAGFQQVEDELSTLRILAQQAAVEEAAVRSAREAERLTLNQYLAGTVPYSSVITAQATRLASEETALTVRQNRLVASVALIQALGGGWDVSRLPTTAQAESGNPGNMIVTAATARQQ